MVLREFEYSYPVEVVLQKIYYHFTVAIIHFITQYEFV